MTIFEKQSWFACVSGRFCLARFSFILYLIVFTTADVCSQDYKQQYRNAQEFFEDGKYNLAMEAFRPLMVYDRSNPYPEYASYFYALSAYQQGYTVLAKDAWLQMRNLYPRWPQQQEVTLWLAKCYFEEREYFQALKMIKELNGALGNESSALQTYYLSKIEDIETLRMLAEEYPDSAVVATLLVKRMLAQPAAQQDGALLNSLISKFQMDRSALEPPAPVSMKKARYRVALLFPFLTKSLEPTPALKPNQFILDLYQGMRFANDSLARQNEHVELLAYDIERNPDVLKKLLATDELRSADVLIGPLLGTEETKMVQEFSQANGIAMINPVTNNSSYLADNPQALLFQPSNETIARRTAEMTHRMVANRNCFVIYGEATKDSILAAQFIQRAREVGLKVRHSERIRKENTARIQPLLATVLRYDEYKNPTEFAIRRDSIGSVFVATDDPLIYSKVISSIQSRNDSTRIFGLESWIAPENSTANFDVFERLRVVISAPGFVDEASPAFISFRKRFVARNGQLPYTYSRLGYEFLFFLRHTMTEHGVYFIPGLQREPFTPGVIQQGYDFNSSRDNQYVPFVTFREGRLELVK